MLAEKAGMVHFKRNAEPPTVAPIDVTHNGADIRSTADRDTKDQRRAGVLAEEAGMTHFKRNAKPLIVATNVAKRHGWPGSSIDFIHQRSRHSSNGGPVYLLKKQVWSTSNGTRSL